MKHVLFGALALLTASATPEEPGAPAAPRGMVTFFDGAPCPTGWQPDSIGAGRILVGTSDPDVIGRVVGTPLAPEEDRAHDHGLTGATIDLAYKSISAADGSNGAGAAAGAAPVTGTVAPATSGLPFVQLTACVRP